MKTSSDQNREITTRTTRSDTRTPTKITEEYTPTHPDPRVIFGCPDGPLRKINNPAAVPPGSAAAPC